MDAAAPARAIWDHGSPSFAFVLTMRAVTSASRRDELRRNMIGRASPWRMPTLILVLTSVLAIALKPVLDGEVSSGLIFVLGITLVGASSGLIPAIVCALLASAIFNFFLADPVLTFRMSTGNDLAPPIIFTACAIISGLLAGRLHDKTYQLGETNLQLESLLETSRNLQKATSEAEVFDALKATVPAMLGINLGVYRFDRETLVPVADSPIDQAWTDVAGRTLGAGTESVRHRELTGYILPGSTGTVGILVRDEPTWSDLDHSFMLALAQVIGLALERAQFASRIAETAANARTEELKSALLSSVSHDLRTPLTTISASASSLIEFGNRLDCETSHNLLQGIVDECGRLNRFTANLLELSRLQSGSVIKGQVLSVNDVVRSVVQRVKSRASGHDIQVVCPQRDILVNADAALFELALTNIIQNSLLYSSAGTTVLISCDCDQNGSVLTITDQGCGIPDGEQDRVFERFYRAKRNATSPQGSGLGLAIAKGFVEAFGGSIELMSPVLGGKGTSVSILLPIVIEAAV